METRVRKARAFFWRKAPELLAYICFFYTLLGGGVAWRMGATNAVIVSSTISSLVFGLGTSVACLFLGALILRIFMVRKALYTDLESAASITMLWSIRLFSILGIPAAIFNVFQVVFPLVDQSADIDARIFVEDWRWWLFPFAGATGWFAGRSLGVLVGLLSVWRSTRALLRKP